MNHTIRWPGAMGQGGKLNHIVVNVYPSPADPGKNVQVAGRLLGRLLGSQYSLSCESTSWESKLIKLTPSSSQFLGIHVHDWSPDDNLAWGGHSDNLLSVSLIGKTAYNATLLLIEFFKMNGYQDISSELVPFDGSYDIVVRDLFVSFKLNVNSG